MTRRRCELCDTLEWRPRDRWDAICPTCRWRLGGTWREGVERGRRLNMDGDRGRSEPVNPRHER